MKFVYIGFSCELYQLHFPLAHTIPQTSLTCKGSTCFGPFAIAVLCCLTSLCLQNDMWLGQNEEVLVKPGLGSFLGLLRASDTVELKDFISSNHTDAFSGLGIVLAAVGHSEEFTV